MSDTSGKYTIPWLNVIILIAASIFALIAGEWTLPDRHRYHGISKS